MPVMLCNAAMGPVLKCKARDEEALAHEYAALVEKHIHSGAHADLYAAPVERLNERDATIYFIVEDKKDEIAAALHVVETEGGRNINGLIKEPGMSSKIPRLLVASACVDQAQLAGEVTPDFFSDIRIYAVASSVDSASTTSYNKKSYAVFADVAFKFHDIDETQLCGNDVDSSLLVTSEQSGIIRSIKMISTPDTLHVSKQWIADMTFGTPLLLNDASRSSVYV